MADTFVIYILHKISKKDSNVGVKIYFKIVFVKDCSMKGMVTSKSTDEVKTKSGILATEVVKVMKSMGGGGADTEGAPITE